MDLVGVLVLLELLKERISLRCVCLFVCTGVDVSLIAYLESCHLSKKLMYCYLSVYKTFL